MKRLVKILLSLVGLYVLFWGAVAAYFSFADRHKDFFESNLSTLFGRDVSIEKVVTSWDGFTPQLQINNLVIAGSTSDQAAFSFSTLSAEIDPMSVLKLWPKFKEFAVASPQLEVVSLEDGSLQVAGLKMGKGVGGSSDKLINWLLDQHSAVWHKGVLVWRRQAKQVQRYEDISFVYQREQHDRQFNAAIETTKGIIALKAQADGDLFSQRDWGANIQVLGSGGRRLLSADDLSAEVIDGQGEVSLKALSVERIQDFLQFAGLTPDQHWLLAADVSGRLHDLKFFFSGPLLKINDWSIQGSASDIAFMSPGDAPSMNNLSGDIRFGRTEGFFRFKTQNSELDWPAQFYHSFPIVQASGHLEWQRQTSGNWDVYLKNASFEDPVISLNDLNAHAQIPDQTRRVESFSDLFEVNNVVDLDFDDGLVVAPKSSPPTLKAQAQFEVMDMSGMVRYLPKLKSLDLFRTWSEEAFQAGVATNGSISYDGELSLSAINQGRASLNMIADFDDTIVDYSPRFRWPAVTDAKGQLRLDNQKLSVLPSEARMNGDPMTDSEIIIERLFELDRTVFVNGKTTTSLHKGLDFLFKGPLIKLENQLETLPFDAQAGALDIDVSVTIPLRKLQNIKVDGSGVIRDGQGLLASGAPLENLQGKILFTERTAKSDDLQASFLGGEVQARLVTVTPAQPPVMRLDAQGVATAKGLEPWLGEHLLTLVSGQTAWQGSILLDGNDIEINSVSDLEGLQIDVPAPIGKTAEQSAHLDIDLGINAGHFSLDLDYREILNARLQTASKETLKDGSKAVSIFDRTMITLREPPLSVQQTDSSSAPISQTADNSGVPAVEEGVNLDLQYPDLNIDDWLSTIIDLAAYKPSEPSKNSLFLDSMRSINLRVQNSGFLACSFGAIDMNLLSVDGKTWIGKFAGDHIGGTARLEPRAGTGRYDFNLSRLNIPRGGEARQETTSIDHALDPSRYPTVNLVVDQFSLDEKQFGQLVFKAAPDDQAWKINALTLTKDGLVSSASGIWTNTSEQGSISRIKFETIIDEAGDALDDIDFKGILRKGKGSIVGELNWIGAPHEFAYSRLNGDFNIFIKDGELVQVEPGGGKILGLLNMNAILRRLAFDFSDVVAAGLRFDRMRFAGVLADGEAVIQDAFVLSPAVFVTMEGNVNIDKELVDMEIHVSPELGGNIALLSALANPAAGAVVFLTQQLFKDDLRRNSFRSFRALGTWDDFELEEISKRGSKEKSKKEDPQTIEQKAIKNQDPVSDLSETISTQE